MSNAMAPVIYFENVRCSFPSLTQPFVSKKFPNSPPMFGIDIIDIPPNDPKIADFMRAYAEIAGKTWGAPAQQIMQMIQTDKRSRCFGMGPEKVNEETFTPLAGYNQGVWINSKSKNRPQMIRSDAKVASNDIEALDLARKIYGGCYVNIAIRPWLRLSNKGVSSELVAIQFVRDGESFEAGGADASSMFGAVASAAPAAPAGFPSFLGQ